ncbi:MAG: Trm112 family protein [Nitratireductor sp.]|nr:Trm112 family protein [Nitratireductor sp.]
MAEPAKTDPYLLTALVCPVSGGVLALSADGGELVSHSARLAFPIRDGIPIMVASEARPLSEVEIAADKSRKAQGARKRQ